MLKTPKKIELLHADKLSNGPDDSDYWICSGNASFTHNNTVINCDYSHHYMKENKMMLLTIFLLTKEIL